MIDKKQIHAFCIKKQEEEVQNFESRVSSLKADVNSHNESASQTEERTAGNVDLLRNYEQELRFSHMEMTNLQSINPAVVNTKVESGAVIGHQQLKLQRRLPQRHRDLCTAAVVDGVVHQLGEGMLRHAGHLGRQREERCEVTRPGQGQSERQEQAALHRAGPFIQSMRRAGIGAEFAKP